ncbi:hypothetical protein EMIHUDRAFT_237947 [Emiliania huxleyi CCMP1516]|uniref:Agenet domain-containing protein n=2 Tax=Emiliania huxleyi TaxID=2903 RepID=A0A0D3JNB9_EMIH1|nr:hypothetical protein EMIHUDRAFT_237947 [Emiliania huxleyi CCMP1516]EOD25004.1 hypothetical protein EMIHUDRAFT_237947 [Emiliania huxleyi CCMP1516]|eukprot:XP_005777433.1 hypothetical protein EMIHUDRAFT_237947 [Emiliania huxleyi CCMP1516]
MMPQAATAEHRGDGVDRRNAHHERSARERSEREAGMRAFEPPPDEEGAVEHLSASVVLAAVEESGPNYLLPKAPEPVKSRRKRLMVDEAARQAGQAILETGTRVEIFAEDSGEERWWPGTIMERTEDTDGRLVHRVQYTNFEGDRYWHVLDDEQWRRVADTGPELEHARAGAGDAALRDGASLAASRPTRWDNARGETAGGASETTGGAGSAETTGQAGSAPDLNWPGRRRVRRSAAMELLRTRDEAEQREARRPDVAPMLTPHSATLSRHLVWVRRLLREYLAELAEDGLSVPMQRTSRGLHPTMRWTVEFGKWLATTRIVESRASSWHLAEEQSAGQAEATARSGRGSNTVYVALQHMKNHVWRELWPAMPADARQYWHWDAHLSEPFEVNVAFIMSAYVCLARQTGCRPGMTMNDANDLANTTSHWHEVPPLRMSDLRIDMDNELGGALTEGAFRALCRMQVTFKRKKGEYFAHYAFGTSITPDSDQMLRIGTLALLRLLLRCGSFRGCYARLSRADAAALRKKVADPRGFAGLELEDTGHESFLSLVRACREDGWVLDEAALSRPLFPAVDTATGRFLFTESFQVKTVCDLLIQTGVSLGMNRHQVGAWSLRKDACEQPVAAGEGEVGARVLGHRHVNSRTMDLVYRADLRTRDLGAYWARRGPIESVERAPLDSLSASRVPEASGVRGVCDLPAGCSERAEMEGCAEVSEAEAELDAARRSLLVLLSVSTLPRHFKVMARAAGHAACATSYEAAALRVRNRRNKARQRAVDAYRLRLYKEGQERLRTSPALRRAMMCTHEWAPRGEDEAVAFGLDRRDRTFELRALRELPAPLQGSILRAGALHVLPRGRTRRTAYEHVRERCVGLCSLECGSDGCVGSGLEMHWPDSPEEFEELRCEHCGAAQVRMRWRREGGGAGAATLVAGEPMAAGATQALGASDAESYGVWYALRGRATIGNAAYDAGAAATVAPSATTDSTDAASDERERTGGRAEIGGDEEEEATGLHPEDWIDAEEAAAALEALAEVDTLDLAQALHAGAATGGGASDGGSLPRRVLRSGAHRQQHGGDGGGSQTEDLSFEDVVHLWGTPSSQAASRANAGARRA